LEDRPFESPPTAAELCARVGGVPEGKEHCPELAAAAARALTPFPADE